MEEITSLKRRWLEKEMQGLREKGVTQAEVARRLGILPQQLNNVLKGNRGISDKFLDSFIEVFDISHFDLYSNTGEHKNRKKIPLYDVESIGGHQDVVADTNVPAGHVAEWIDAGDWFPGATSAIRHYGDSMVEYPSGCILALKRVEDDRLLINGQNYVIETSEYRITKQLQYDGGDYLMAYSSNRDTYPDGRQIHSPIRIPKSEIRHIDLVLGCVIKEYSNGPVQIIKK